MPTVTFEDGIEIDFLTPPSPEDIDFAYKQANPDANLWEVAKEGVKQTYGALTGIERAIGASVKSYGEFLTSPTGQSDLHTKAITPFALHPKVQEATKKVSHKVGTMLTALGKDSIDYYTNIAPKPDPKFWSGKFTGRNTWQKAVAATAGAIPSLGAAAAVTLATGNPFAGAGMLGTIYGADEYENARQAGKSVEEAGVIGLLNAVGNTVLEVLPLSQFLKAGKPLTRAAVIGVQEGTEEVLQQLWSNTIAKHGYDATREYTEGVVLAGVAGAGSGGLLGGLTRGGIVKMDAFEDQLKSDGMTDEQVDVMRDSVTQQIQTHGEEIEAKLSGAEDVAGVPVTDVEGKVTGVKFEPPLETPGSQVGPQEEGVQAVQEGQIPIIPEFKNSNEAIAFGTENKDNPAVLEALGQKRDQMLQATDAETDPSKAFILAQKAQLPREALEAAQGKISPELIQRAGVEPKAQVEGSEPVKDATQTGRISEQRKAKITKSIVSLLPEDVDIAKGAVEAISAGEAGRRAKTVTGDWHGIPSTFPDYFKNKGYTKKESLKILNDAIEGKPLTEKQAAIAKDLIEGARPQLTAEAEREAFNAALASEREQARVEGFTTEQIEENQRAGEKEADRGVVAEELGEVDFPFGALAPPTQQQIPGTQPKLPPGPIQPTSLVQEEGSGPLFETPSGEATTGGFAQVPVLAPATEAAPLTAPPKKPPETMTLGAMDELQPFPLPEMVAFTKEISEHTPEVGMMRSPQTLGRHKEGALRLHPWLFLNQAAVDQINEEAGQYVSLETYKKTGEVLFSADYKRKHRPLVKKALWITDMWQPNIANKVFAHEIGHLVDWLPEGTTKRGNLIGHALSSVHSFLKQTFDTTNLFDDSGAKIGTTLSNRTFRKELKALTQFWKPFDEAKVPEKFKAYRYSSKELYADFISVLLNTPQRTTEIAPQFTEAFFDNIEKKPEVKQAFARLQQLLHEPDDSLLAEREGRILEGYMDAQEAANLIRAKAIAKRKSWWFKWKDYWTADAALRQLAKETVGDAETRPIMDRVETLALRNAKVQAAMLDFDEQVWKPLLADNLTPADLGLHIQLTRVAKGDRSPLANPGGFDPDTAETQLGFLKKRLGPDRYATVEKLGREVRTWYKEINGQYPDLFTADQKETIENNEYYAPFQVVEYLENWISAGFAPQIGTLKDIRNPLDSLVMKAASVIMTGEKNVIIKSTMKGLLPHTTEADGLFPAHVTMIEGKTPHVKRKTGFDPILWKEDGSWQAAYAEPDVAESFNRTDNRVAAANGWFLATHLANKAFRTVFITLSPGFQAVNVLVRDPGRTWANLGILPYKGYLKAFGPAVKRSKGQFDPTIQKMLKEGALPELFNDLLAGKSTYDSEVEAQFEKYGGATEPQNINILKRAFQAIQLGGNVLETISKVAGFQELKRQGVPAGERAAKVRRYIGTPSRRPGKGFQVYNNAFMFSEMFKEGWRSDLEVATNPKTRVGWWMRSLSIGVLPKLLMVFAAAGYFGEEIRKQLAGSSEYMKTNYHIIPLGEDERGKPITFTLPIPDTQRVLGGLAWKLMSPFIGTLSDIREGKTPRAPEFGNQKWQQLFAFGAGAVPSPAPGAEMLTAWAAYLSGGQPRDWFRDQPILTEDEAKAGGSDAFWPMFKWTINQSGFTKMDLHARPDSDQSMFEQTISFAPGINRFIRVSDYGIAETAREAAKPVQAELARERLTRRKSFASSIDEDLSDREALEVAGLLKGTKTKSQVKAALRNFKQVKGSKDDPIARVLRGMRSWQEQVPVVESVRDQYTPEEFKEYLKQLYDAGLLSRKAGDMLLAK